MTYVSPFKEHGHDGPCGDLHFGAAPDMVNHPPHYGAGRFGVECIEFTRLMPFCTGNAFKYAFRHLDKGNAVQDLEKARVYAHWARDEKEAAALPGRRRELQTLYFRHLHERVGTDVTASLLGHIVFEEWEEAEILLDTLHAAAEQGVELSVRQ